MFLLAISMTWHKLILQQDDTLWILNQFHNKIFLSTKVLLIINMSPHKPDSAIYILYIVMVLQISNVVDSHIRFTLCTYVKNIYFSNIRKRLLCYILTKEEYLDVLKESGIDCNWLIWANGAKLIWPVGKNWKLDRKILHAHIRIKYMPQWCGNL